MTEIQGTHIAITSDEIMLLLKSFGNLTMDLQTRETTGTSPGTEIQGTHIAITSDEIMLLLKSFGNLTMDLQTRETTGTSPSVARCP